jgi:hypothetical protein
MAMDLVSSVTVGSGGVSSIEFTNIPQSGKDLCLITSLRVSDGNEAGFVNVNNATGTIFPLAFMWGMGSTVEVNNYNNDGFFFMWWNDSSRTTNVFANAKLTFSQYTRTEYTKNFTYEAATENTGSSYLVMASGLFNSSNPITSVKFTPQSSATFIQHSIASLYIIS